MKFKYFLSLLTLCCSINMVQAVDTYYLPSDDNQVFKMDIYNEGETLTIGGISTGRTSTYTLNEGEVGTVLDAVNTWTKALNVNSSIVQSPITLAVLTMDDYNAAAQTLIFSQKDGYITPHILPVLQGLESDDSGFPFSLILAGRGIMPDSPYGWNIVNGHPALYSGNGPYFYSVVLHEFMHAIGITSTTDVNDDFNCVFSLDSFSPIGYYDSHLRIYKEGAEVVPQPGMAIRLLPSDYGEFDILNYSPYFSGEHTLSVLTDTYDKSPAEMLQILIEKGGLKNYSKAYESITNPYLARPIVYGMPVHPYDASMIYPNFSHLELRNSFMSHQNFRNWYVPMEAEYAVLQDLGYNINTRKYFGKSYYLNNITEENSIGFSKWDDNTQAYTNEKSDTVNAVGIHIYGDNNNITLNSNILSSGEGSIGTRIEGVNNTYTLKNGNQIDMSGNQSLGIAATWGKGHTINVEEGATVKSTGEQGIGASFDFGSNLLGDYLLKRGSYIHYVNKEVTGLGYDQFIPVTETQGALVENFNVEGSIYGKQAAIYIADNAYVKNINIMNNAVIEGDIISDWNSTSSGDFAIISFNNGGSWIPANPSNEATGYFTNLNFGTSGNPYTGTFRNNISGDNGIFNTLKMSVSSGSNLTLENSDVNVYNLENKGTINIDKRVNISTQKDTNSISGGGNINVNESGMVTLSDTVKSVYNKIKVDPRGTFSTANNVESAHTIDKIETHTGSNLSFDVGDVITINDTTGSDGKTYFSSVKVSQEELDQIEQQGLDYEKELFGGQTINMGDNTFNVYHNGMRYTFEQKEGDLAKIKVKSLREASYCLSEAAADSSAGNYIVQPGEIQNEDGGTVKGYSFEISGSDINWNGHKGLIIDGNDNPAETIIKTNTKNATANDEYKATYTVQNSGTLIVQTDNKDVEISPTTNSSEYPSRSLYVDNTSTARLNALNNNKIKISGKIQGEAGTNIYTEGNKIELNDIDSVNLIQTANNTNLAGVSTNTAWDLRQGSLNINKDSYLSSDGTNSITFNGGSLNLQNNEASKIKLASMNVNSNTDVKVDVDFKARTMDRFEFQSTDDLSVEDVSLNLSSFNMINSDKIRSDKIKINFISPALKNTNLLGKVNSNVSQVMTPIFKYNLSYSETDTTGDLTLSLPAGGAANYENYNPTVFAAPVAAQAGVLLNQLSSYNISFSNMDMMMNLPSNERKAMLLRNRYAIADSSQMVYQENYRPEYRKGIWFKPYTSIERVDLNDGPDVTNFNYGAFAGGDSNTISLGHGWNSVFSGYIGYNGSHQKYTNVNSYINGAQLGVSGVFFRNKFFMGLTGNFGASIGEADTMYGRDRFDMINAGGAIKTGYNFEFKDGRYIIQPNYTMSYSYVNTFDYISKSGATIFSDPLNTIQVVPGFKIIMNTLNGWQPYLSAQMIWNVLNNSNVKANYVELPTISVRPYFQYGIGAQKNIGEYFTCYGQTMFRNGGRTGASLALGMKWVLGRNQRI